MTNRVSWVLLLAILSVLNVRGQALQRGDLLVSTFECLDPVTFPCPGESQVTKILVYGSDGAFKRKLIQSNGAYFDTVVDQAGFVWAALGFPLQKIDSGGNVVASYSAGRDLFRLAPAADGRLFASDDHAVVVFGGDGAVLRIIDLSNQPGSAGQAIDLAADQCTLYYSSAGSSSVLRYNACTNEFLGLLATVEPSLETLRLLPDSSLLVAGATATSSGVLHLSAAGAVIRGYSGVAGLVALDVDGKSFWSTGNKTLYKIDIDSGQVLIGPVNVGLVINGIGVVGEPRVATSSEAIAAIPTLSTWVLFALATILATIAVIRIRVH